MTNRSRAALGFLMVLGVLAGARSVAAQDDELASPKLRISWADFRKLYEAGGLVLIDVRDSASFEAGHIPGARSVPLSDVESKAAELDRLEKPIVLYCA